VLIRPTTRDDLPALYEVCLRTGLAGADATDLYDDADLLGTVFVGPYVALAEGVGYCIVDEHGPGGYVLGTADTRAFEAACERDWWPAHRARLADRGPSGTVDDLLVAHVRRPPRAPDDLLRDFPAHLHIDLLPRLQGRGLGPRMIDTLLHDLASAGARGVHLPVAAGNVRAIGFYEHLGFRDVGSGRDGHAADGHESTDERIMARRL
jgi:ribosomal protein S18 acetylase RimI-like enzyme